MSDETAEPNDADAPEAREPDDDALPAEVEAIRRSRGRNSVLFQTVARLNKDAA